MRQLWWFLDGAIMHADTRVALRRSWGLCPRHAWGMATVECELRGGLLLATAVLYADLVAGAAATLAARRLRSPARRLEPAGHCPTCRHLEQAVDAPPEWSTRAATVNQRARLTRMVAEAWPEAAAHTCPACAEGDGPTCRPHLLLGGDASDGLPRSVRHLAVRMHAYEKSLTVDGAPVQGRGRAAWLETLAWFGGWRLPFELARR